MNILLAAATAMETDLFRQQYREHSGTRYPAIAVDFLETGVGMLSAAVSLCSALTRREYQLIIQAGIAGSFDTVTPLGSVYQVSEEIIGDLGVEENKLWKDVFDMNLVKPNDAPFVDRSIPSFKLKQEWQPSLRSAKAISVNEISTRAVRIQQLKLRYDPLLESMEGAALHYVGNVFNVPFIQIRSTSNHVGERSKHLWKMKEAIINLNEELASYLKQLNKSL